MELSYGIFTECKAIIVDIPRKSLEIYLGKFSGGKICYPRKRHFEFPRETSHLPR